MKKNYKITVIGDIHGRDSWKEIVNAEIANTTKFIFLGDYFDSIDIPAAKQLENFKDITAFKKANMNQVVLLCGNHDYHYISDDRYSGYNEHWHILFTNAFAKAISEELIQMCYEHDGALFSHAGVSTIWLNKHSTEFERKELKIDELINNIFYHNPDAFKFVGYEPHGDYIGSSPIWIRPRSLAESLVPNYAHVVGHTQQTNILFKKPGIVLVDTLGTSGEYLQIENGNSIIKNILLEDMPF